MNNLLNSKAVLFVIVAICGTLAFLCRAVYAVPAAVTAWLALLRLLRRIEGQRNWNAIIGALADFDEIIGGHRWIGKDAEILASNRVDPPGELGPVRYEHICRTKAGSWFIFEVAVKMGRVVFCELRPCNETTAQDRLQSHKNVYSRCFGQPTVA